MSKKEIFEYIMANNRKYAGRLVMESGYKKYFPESYEEMKNTNFPSFFDEFDFKQKLWHFLHDDYTEHFCKCGGKLSFRGFWYGYNEFCKPNCPAMIENQVKCVKEKCSLRTDEEKKQIIEKVNNTMLERYGVTRFSQTDEWREITINTNREKFGKDWYSQTEDYKNSYENSCEKKYGKGIKNPAQADEVKKKINEKFYASFLKRHPNIIEIKGDILVCKCHDLNCNLCEKKIYEIDKTTFSCRNNKNIDTCTIRNEYGTISSSSENMVYDYISSIYGGEIIRNDRSVLGGKELDIYLPELNIAFEFNGVYWHSEIFKSKNYHQDKTLKCMEMGVQLIQIWEDDWTYKQDIIKNLIKTKLNKNDVNIAARKCVVKEIKNSDAYVFLQQYHLQGGVKSGKSLGLFFNDELVEVMTFGVLRKNMGGKPSSGHYEIYRLCSKQGYNVQGGFSKLLSYFEKVYKPSEVITYANLDYSYGNVYLKVGFEKTHVTKPTYAWVVGGMNRRHRSNFAKSKLQECKDNPNLTEVEVMHNRNCWRCWDSGKIKFVKNY